MSNRQNGIGPFVRGMSKMYRSLRMKDRQASLFDEGTAGIREFHIPSLIAGEQVESVLSFEVGNLFGEGRLADMQSVRSPREVPLLGQGNDCLQVTNFEVGEHG
jgi:hypothetical protein